MSTQIKSLQNKNVLEQSILPKLQENHLQRRFLGHLSCKETPVAATLQRHLLMELVVQRNAHALKNKIVTPPPTKKNKKKTLNEECYGHGGFPAGRTRKAPIKLAQPFPARELRAKKNYGHEVFCSEYCKLFKNFYGAQHEYTFI